MVGTDASLLWMAQAQKGIVDASNQKKPPKNYLWGFLFVSPVGFEPTALRLKGGYSATELRTQHLIYCM